MPRNHEISVLLQNHAFVPNLNLKQVYGVVVFFLMNSDASFQRDSDSKWIYLYILAQTLTQGSGISCNLIYAKNGVKITIFLLFFFFL